MGLLVAILIVAALLAGFLLLTALEARSGKRVLSSLRNSLDRKTEGAVRYLVSDDARFSLSKSARAVLDHVVHDVVRVVLIVVRFVERTLTRLARDIRGRRAKEEAPDPVE